MSGSILPVWRLQVNYNGKPAAGALLYSYLSGTSTPSPLYNNADLAVGHRLTNPVQADASGVFPIMYMDALSYRIFVTTSIGETIYAAQDDIYDLWQLAAGTTQTANTVFAGPTSGAAAAPTFRALVVADLPAASLPIGVCEGRLTLTSGSPVTTSDVTAATTLYYTPYQGNRIALYDGSAWGMYTFTEKSIAVPATTSQMYDVWLFNNSGTLTLELTAWTNDTTRATALANQDGVIVKSGAATRRYLGSFRTTGSSGQTEDSAAKRYVWNNYNRVDTVLAVMTATSNWAYSTATYRQANASATNQLDIVVGSAEDAVDCRTTATVSNSAGNVALSSAIAYDSTSTPTATGSIGYSDGQAAAENVTIYAHLVHYPAVGRHVYVWLERSGATPTTTWQGVSTGIQSGINGSWRR